MDMRSLVTAQGPFASVYFDASHDTEDAAEQFELRWRGLKEQLLDQGIDNSTVDAMDTVVRRSQPPAGRAGRALVASGGRVLVDEWLPEPPPVTEARASDLPYVLPLVSLSRHSVPHIVVVVDRTGADLRAVDRDGNTVESETVTGRDHPLHKVRGGGWAHYRFQRNVEETVRRNMKDFADEVAQLAGQLGARLIVVAGEVQARTDLHRELPTRCQQIAVQVESATRAEGADNSALEQDVERLVSQCREPGDHDPALEVQGLAGSAAALRESNVAALLVTDQVHDQVVWSGTVPNQVAVREDELRGLGMPSIVQRRADEALPFAALSVGADIVVTDDQLVDGVGVLTRHT